MQSINALVIHPVLKHRESGRRTAEARLAETVNLAAAIALDTVHAEVIRLGKVRPSTYLGRGATDRLAECIKTAHIEVAVLDCALSPVQQRNLERALNCKVIDRTALILEIFGARARTREGVMQVELAHLDYQRSRLVRSWTHLERQRGGFGFLGGPGETQIEIDRRLLTQRITKLKRELSDVTRTRGLQRGARQRVPYPVVALVGYTNAGKSTLFNALTQSAVFARDQLFATLDPTLRELTLPSGRRAIISDTVGFVADLPHELVAAFRATLEEVLEADLILHVRDIAHPDSEAQKADVETVLEELGVPVVALGRVNGHPPRLIEVLNKTDLLDEATASRLSARAAEDPWRVPVSAETGKGLEGLLASIERALAADRELLPVSVPLDDGAAIAWFYRRGEVIGRHDDEAFAHMSVRLDKADADKVRTERTHLQANADAAAADSPRAG